MKLIDNLPSHLKNKKDFLFFGKGDKNKETTPTKGQ